MGVSGTFYMRTWEGGKEKWKAIGTDPSQARIAVVRKEREFNGGGRITGSKTLREAIDIFLAERSVQQDVKTVNSWRNELARFEKITPKIYLKDIDRSDVFAYWNSYKAEGAAPWRQDPIDRTLMAFLLVHLHGKITDSLSNQMRQTKAMAPKYAVAWWREHEFRPPDIDPVSFLRKKFDWRYAKGTPKTTSSRLYLGDSTGVLRDLRGDLSRLGLHRASLLLTSPPYFGVTNYHYDQWLRLWLLGGPPTDHRSRSRYAGKHRGKFENREIYQRLLTTVFRSSLSAYQV